MNKIFITLGLTAIFGFSVVIRYFNTNDYELSELEIANIEALAETENPTESTPCFYDGIYSVTSRYIECKNCAIVLGYKGSGREGTCYAR